MASKRRLREAKEKTFRGNSGTDYRAKYYDELNGTMAWRRVLDVPEEIRPAEVDDVG